MFMKNLNQIRYVSFQLRKCPSRSFILPALLVNKVAFGTSVIVHKTATDSDGSIEEKMKKIGPLANIRVLDLTRVLAGPYCTMLLGDMGAEIIKIERPDGGDDTREWKPPSINDESSYFLSVNRNKKSVCIDFNSEAGISALHELAKKSDVIIENFIPDSLKKRKLDYETISKINPRIVYCSISGFGSSGPYAKKPGYDVIVSAIGGLMASTGPENGPPVKTGVALVDLMTGLNAYGAIASALLARHITNRGQLVECSLLETQISALANLGSNCLTTGQDAKRWGTAHESIVPYQAFKTSDGFVLVAALNNVQFEKLCSVLDRPDLAKNKKFLNNPDRVENRVDLIDILEKEFLKNTTKKWCTDLEKVKLACGPINSITQALDDPQVLHREMVVDIEHPRAGKIKMLGTPVKYSDTKPSIRSAPPLLGEHTNEVLREILGYTEKEISKVSHLEK